MNFLDTVIPIKQDEVAQLKKKLRKNRFAELCTHQTTQAIVIAEIKPKSPSGGQLLEGDPVKLVAEYEAGDADAISVLTDTTFFGGSPELFTRIRQATDLPLLRKEFIVDEVQLVESLQLGADAVLLIVQLLSEKQLARLISFAKTLGLVPLVEIIDESELQLALAAGATYIGVNARDLRTLKVNQARALQVLQRIPDTIHKFLFSGIETGEDVRSAIEARADGLLIGTSLLRAEEPSEKLRELKRVATGRAAC